jgi:hypothetical protein
MPRNVFVDPAALAEAARIAGASFATGMREMSDRFDVRYEDRSRRRPPVTNQSGGTAMQWPAALVIIALIVAFMIWLCCPTCSFRGEGYASDEKGCTYRSEYVGRGSGGIPAYNTIPVDCD